MANGESCNIPLDAVIGRCYELLGAELMFGTRSLDYDVSGVMESRHYSAQADARIPADETWFRGDCRFETLPATKWVSSQENGHNGLPSIRAARPKDDDPDVNQRLNQAIRDTQARVAAALFNPAHGRV
ncbi:uncharacterized protein N7515_010142 [Penicillium bovifimosum]|uniref:Uncharacterized protein n=1 Tax=Penicillium bovifimosum TaxID=126998 RepID=A0A9W9GI88_9EURO|nr:uncharacterized protein N7515_010142 [Penicillium bovifimosum]KAJ5120754.1 hypothetical protein N7515_010142 [Penicillium bovifimosum]